MFCNNGCEDIVWLGHLGGGLRLASVFACVLVMSSDVSNDESFSDSSLMLSRVILYCWFCAVFLSCLLVSLSFICVICSTASFPIFSFSSFLCSLVVSDSSMIEGFHDS